MATHSSSRPGIAVLIAVLVCGCGASIEQQGDTADSEVKQVIFSVANKDRGAPVTVLRVVVNGRTLIYGSLQPAGRGDYLYVSTEVTDPKLHVRVTSETDDGPSLETEKTMLVEDLLWVVITRVQDIDGDPELVIEVSYEKPELWNGE